MKYLVYYNADGQPGREFITLRDVDAFTEDGVRLIESVIRKRRQCENVILLNMIPLRG